MDSISGEPPRKKCPECGEFKPHSEFYPHKKMGRATYCKPCQKRRNHEYYLLTREATLERQKQRQVEKADEIRAAKKRHYESHREYWQAANLRRIEERKQNPAKFKVYQDTYVTNHPDQCRASRLNCRARQFGAEGIVTAEEIRSVYEKAGERCQACGTDETLCLDYVTLLRHGGRNEVENLQILCRP